MTALAAILGPSPEPAATARRMLAVDSAAAGEPTAVHVQDAAVLAVTRPAWQRRLGLGGALGVAQRDGVAVVADAALYYRDELRRALADAHVAVPDDDPATLVLGAYLAWGAACAARLDGDFAFVVWDGRRHTLTAARDWVGRRTLYWGTLPGGGLALATTARGVRAHPGVPRALDLRAIAATAAGFLGAVAESAFAGVQLLPAGHTLVAAPGRAPVVSRHWEPPVFENAGRPARAGLAEAAEELRRRLGRAVVERLAPEAPTAVWMSGGWDSPPVFAAGRAALAEGGRSGDALRPVSVSYPEGDPGREDEIIARIAAHWGSEPAWVDSTRVPLLGPPDEALARAARRDQPLAHVFERWNEALAARSRAIGATVALDGIGGDALFQLSPVFLADLLADGRWGTLRREWRHADPRGPLLRRLRAFERWALRPALPAGLLDLAAVLRGRPLAHHRQRALPPWIARDFARRAGLARLGVPDTARRAGESRAALESRWYLDAGWSPAVLAATSALGAAAGVEVRSPYYDRRVVALAASRPREERRSSGETKRLLRASARALLPADVLAPRAARTGTTGGYFAERMRAELPPLLAALGPLALADHGIVDPPALDAAVSRFLARPTPNDEAGALFFTVQAEMWVRGECGVRSAD